MEVSVVPECQALTRLTEIAEQLGEDSVAAELRQLTTRIGEGRFFVACVGQFKRGKSTLLNALAGEAILPTGVVPVTMVPTVLRHGRDRAARVLIDSEWRTLKPEQLADYVTEERNPENRKRVEGAEVFLPAPLLASGMCLVDTPGIGSVFSGNTETTRDFIPQIDAAILVLGADPPISGEELELVEAVAASADNIVVVLNKIDRVSLTERQQASEFARNVLAAGLKKPIARIYEVSALNQLNGSADADWALLIADLHRLADESGLAMTRSAAMRGARRFTALLQRSVEERIRALTAPIASSEQRIAELRRVVVEAEQSLRDLGVLFAAEQARLSNTLLTRRKEFLREALPAACQELESESHRVASFGPARRHELMNIAQTIARRHVMPWLDSEKTQGEELYRAVTQRFVALVNNLLLCISQERSGEFLRLPNSLEDEPGFRSRSRFFFHEMITIAKPASPLVYCLDLLLGILRIDRWFRSDAEDFLDHLLDTNSSRVQSDIEQRVVESRLRLESEMRRLLREVSRAAELALTKAREVMAAGASAVEDERRRLGELQVELPTIAR